VPEVVGDPATASIGDLVTPIVSVALGGVTAFRGLLRAVRR
jgi:hypothetical protein